MDFEDAKRHYTELKRQFDARTISVDVFNAERQRLMVQDDEGRWWSRSPNNDKWTYYDGSAWIPGTPPGYQEGVPEPTNSSTQAPSAPHSKGVENGRRRIPSWILLAGLIGMAALVGGIGAIAAINREDSKSGVIASTDTEESKAAPGYSLVKDDSETLSMEVPTEWRERIVSDSEGEKGKHWGSYSDDPISIAAVNNFNSWRTGARGHEGVYIVASKELAQSYTDNELVALGPNDYSSSCEAGHRRDFNRPGYSGRMQLWENCGGDSDHNALTLAAAPEGRECAVVLQTGGYLQPEEDERVWHVFDTFKVDCSRL